MKITDQLIAGRLRYPSGGLPPANQAAGHLSRLWQRLPRVSPCDFISIQHIQGRQIPHTNTSRNTTHNAASLLTAIGKHKDIPLHIGQAKALERPALHAPTDIHGNSGLDGTDLLPKPECAPSAVPAVQAMADALGAQAPGTAWLVATGALTNVGALLREHPRLASHLAGLSLMGGSIGEGFSDAPLGQVDGKERIGNYTPYAEFNILVDPEAAAEVFSNPELKRKTAIVPLDLSHQVLATEDVRDLLMYGKDGQTNGEGNGNGKTTLRQMLVELLYYFSQTYAYVF